jgi:transcription initiation factor TFIIIB Brf1 subunit/transcription initiation factor TFIIB
MRPNCLKCKSKNVYVKAGGAIVCRRCGAVSKPT